MLPVIRLPVILEIGKGLSLALIGFGLFCLVLTVIEAVAFFVDRNRRRGAPGRGAGTNPPWNQPGNQPGTPLVDPETSHGLRVPMQGCRCGGHVSRGDPSRGDLSRGELAVSQHDMCVIDTGTRDAMPPARRK